MSILPDSGQIMLPELVEAIRSAPAELFIRPEVSARALLIERNKDDWVNFATVLRVGLQEDAQPVEHRLKKIRLLAFRLSAASIVDLLSFQDALRLTGRSDGGSNEEFQNTTYVYREYSGNPYTHSEPCWRLDISGKTSGITDVALPNGPFLGTSFGFQARSVAEAAAKWFNDPSLKEASNTRNIYRVVLPDRRAFISALNATKNEMRVGITQNLKGELYCTYHAIDIDGAPDEGIVPVMDGWASVGFKRSVRALEIDLFDANSQCFDRYHENEFRGSWGKTFFNEDARLADPKYGDLRRALDQGESEHVEFKPYIALSPRNPKARELLQTAVAFANARGGSIYIGVTDDAEVIGIDTNALNASLGSSVGGEALALRDEYARLVRSVLTQGVTPPLEITVEGITHAELWVLRVGVKAGTQTPYAIVEDGDIRIRRAGTNRKPTPTELRQLLRPPTSPSMRRP
jgi:hypothetical protein